jgi:hypothetical protein
MPRFLRLQTYFSHALPRGNNPMKEVIEQEMKDTSVVLTLKIDNSQPIELRERLNNVFGCADVAA